MTVLKRTEISTPHFAKNKWRSDSHQVYDFLCSHMTKKGDKKIRLEDSSEHSIELEQRTISNSGPRVSYAISLLLTAAFELKNIYTHASLEMYL